MSATTLTDASQLIACGALHAGVDFFVGYPITPASGIFSEMIRAGVGIAAPDEITALQYLIGGSACGRKAMTATSGPGFLLMTEGLGAAFAMELPLTVVLVQRLGPATGSATMNAQGDILLAGSMVSGAFTMPVLCPPSVEECAAMTVHAVNLAEQLRVPVILLTEKEMVVGRRSIDASRLELPPPRDRVRFTGDAAAFRTYAAAPESEVPPFRPVGDDEVQVRITSSTHDEAGQIVAFNDRTRQNTERLLIHRQLDLFPKGTLDADPGAEDMILSFGFTNYAAADAVRRLRAMGRPVAHYVVRTLFPVLTGEIAAALQGIRRLIIPEESLTGQYRRILRGEGLLRSQEIVGINAMGRCITAEEIVAAVTGEPAAEARR